MPVAPWAREGSTGHRSRSRLVGISLCALIVVAGAVLVSGAALADKYSSDAEGIVQTEPRAAIEKAEDSLALNDEALRTYYVRAAAYARVNDYVRARATLLAATRREPHDFVPWGLLGDLAVRRRDFAQARRDYAQAARLNPRDANLANVARDPRIALAPPR